MSRQDDDLTSMTNEYSRAIEYLGGGRGKKRVSRRDKKRAVLIASYPREEDRWKLH